MARLAALIFEAPVNKLEAVESLIHKTTNLVKYSNRTLPLLFLALYLMLMIPTAILKQKAEYASENNREERTCYYRRQICQFLHRILQQVIKTVPPGAKAGPYPLVISCATY